MPRYDQIRDATDQGQRTLERLLRLRRALDAEIPSRRDELILLATWNIREFDSNAYGVRTNEPMQYIAEIIARFDIVAVTEVRSDLSGLRKLLGLLGPQWDYLVTDVTEGTAGNNERIAIVYDTSKVQFGGLAGELVLPPVDTEDANGDPVTVPASQLARTPLLAGFRAGSVDFLLAVFHIIWGDGIGRRREEMTALADALSKRVDDRTSWSPNIVVLGDFNIGSPDDMAWEEMRSHGWTIPPDFETDIRGTNISQEKFYDQIAIRPREGRFEIAQIDDRRAAGAFNFFDVVYRPQADFETYRSTMEAFRPNRARSNFRRNSRGEDRTEAQQRTWYRDYWRTHQMSDHLPLWVAIRTDNTNDELTQRLGNEV